MLADVSIAVDGVYDTKKILRYYSENGINPQISISINFSGMQADDAS